MEHRISSLLICAAALFAASFTGHSRDWTSAADPSKVIKGDLVRAEGKFVTLRLENGKNFRFEIDKLSAADQEFIKTGKEPKPKARVIKNPAIILTEFVFGENPDQVYLRLKDNPKLEGGVSDILRGRVGLNGIYYAMIDGMKYGLYFEFDQNNALFEVSLQSEPLPVDKYEAALKDSWKSVRSELEEVYGESMNDTGYPKLSQLADGVTLSSDIFKVNRYHIYLGVGRNTEKVSCLIRYQNQTSTPVD